MTQAERELLLGISSIVIGSLRDKRNFVMEYYDLLALLQNVLDEKKE